MPISPRRGNDSSSSIDAFEREREQGLLQLGRFKSRKNYHTTRSFYYSHLYVIGLISAHWNCLPTLQTRYKLQINKALEKRDS